MKDALKLCQRSGFIKIPELIGNTGHSGCDVSMILDLPAKENKT